MCNGSDEFQEWKTFLHRLLCSISPQYSWCPDANVWWPQLPSSEWHYPTSSWGYDRWYHGGIRWWWFDRAPKSKKLPDDENRFPKVWMAASIEDYHPAAIPWNHPKWCSWFLCRLRAKPYCWWGYCLATRAWSHCKSSHCRLPGQ